MENMIQILMAALGSVGFAVLFNVRSKKLILFFFCGALDWAVYLACVHWGASLFVAQMFATMTAALIAEVFARLIHVPVLILLVPMLIPLVPGKDLYYTMYRLIQGDNSAFLFHAQQAVIAAGAIVMGIISVTAFVQICLSVGRSFQKMRAKIKS